MTQLSYTASEAKHLTKAYDRKRNLALSVQNVSHGFGDKQVLCHINFEIGRGQIVGLVGPSGCGKSTLLRAIVGTHLAKTGSVIVHGHAKHGTGDITVTAPGRDRGIVYQKYTLAPNLTAIENVAKGLEWDQTTLPDRLFRPLRQRRLRKEWKDQAAELLIKVGLGEALDRYPYELSGGMCQRVAIAQALIMKPEVLLMDEPFGALDEATREGLQRMMLALYGENVAAMKADRPPPYTVIIVTHELNEALYLGDRVIGLSQYWSWQDGLRLSGGHHATFERSPGATVVYDTPAPVHDADGNRDFEALREQREEIRRVVFEPEVHVTPGKHITFWDRVNNDGVQGVMA